MYEPPSLAPPHSHLLCPALLGVRDANESHLPPRPRDASESRVSSGEPLAPSNERSDRVARVEAALLVASGPLTTRKLAQVAMLQDHKEASEAIEWLNDSYDRSASAFRIERVASGFRMMTRPHLATWLDKRHNRQEGLTLTPPAMETLVIIAYRQPITRVAIEQLRGVQSTEMIRQLLDRGLIKVTGQEETLGRPFLYGTTRQFLEEFGLRSLADLPEAGELRRSDAIKNQRPEQDAGSNDVGEPGNEDGSPGEPVAG